MNRAGLFVCLLIITSLVGAQNPDWEEKKADLYKETKEEAPEDRPALSGDRPEPPEEVIEVSEPTEGTIGLLDIIGDSLDPDTLESCLNWRPVGVCLWWTPPSSISASLKVAHSQPDFVISSHYAPGGNPWQEMQALYGDVAYDLGTSLLGSDVSGHGNTEPKAHQRTTGLAFREVDVFGAPLAGWFKSAGGGYFCPSEARSYQPYFMSTLDAMFWRDNTLELLYPQSWIPGLEEIGDWPLDRWGSVFPRWGFAIQHNPWRASFVMAMRGGDLVTRIGVQPHIVRSSHGGRNPGGYQVWWPPRIKPGRKGGLWQMLYPESTKTCSSYGDREPRAEPSVEARLQVSKARVAYQVWRPYRCCPQKGTKFLGSIDWWE